MSGLEELTTSNLLFPSVFLSPLYVAFGHRPKTVQDSKFPEYLTDLSVQFVTVKYYSYFCFTTSCSFSHALIQVELYCAILETRCSYMSWFWYTCTYLSYEASLTKWKKIRNLRIMHTTAALWCSKECYSWGLDPPSTQVSPPPSKSSSLLLYLSKLVTIGL